MIFGKWIQNSLLARQHTVSLRTRIISWTLSITTALVFLIVLALGFVIHNREEAKIQARQRAMAENAAAYVGLFVEHSMNSLVLLDGTRKAYLANNPRVFDTLMQENPAIMEIVVVDEARRVVVSSSREPPGLTDSTGGTQPAGDGRVSWLQNTAVRDRRVEIVRPSPEEDPFIVESIPMQDGSTLAARLRMDTLLSAIAGFRIGSEEHAYMIDQAGKIILPAGPGGPAANVDYQAPPAYVSSPAAENLSRVGYSINFEGQAVIGASAPVPGTGWLVVTEAPVSAAFADVWNRLLVLTAAVLLVTIVNALIYLRELRRLVFEPLGRLKQGVDRLAGGDMTARIRMAQKDEIGSVASAFDRMTEAIRQHQDELTAQSGLLAAEIGERRLVTAELEALNADLEKRVRDRTVDLEHEVAGRQQIEQELRRSLERITLFNRVISSGSTNLEPERVLQVVCIELANAMRVPRAIFSLIDPENCTATVIAETHPGNGVSVMGTASPVRGNAQTEYIVANRRPLYLANLQTDRRYCPLREIIQAVNLQSALIVPLIWREKVLGLLLLGSFVNREYQPDEIALIQTVTTAAGQIFENARLHAEVQQELSERRLAEARLVYQSTHDSLTGLYNRMYFEEQLQKLEVEHSAPVSLIMLDMDELKIINDRLGHAAGDEYLRRLADILKRVFRDEDIVARLGGDEFAVLLNPATPEDAAAAVHRLKASIDADGGGLPAGPLHASIGSATSEAGASVVEALRRADGAMYDEKARKRPQPC